MEILLGLLLLVALHSAKTPFATGLKPEPEPYEPPHHEPEPEPAPHPSVTPHGGGPTPSPAAPEPYPVPPPGPAHPKPAPAPAPHAQPAHAPTVPVSWPQAPAKDLPVWPAGWEPDTPVPAAVVARAKQLLPELWKSGKAGAKKTEQTAGKWVTYLAFVPSKGKKGVAAFRPKPGSGGTVQA